MTALQSAILTYNDMLMLIGVEEPGTYPNVTAGSPPVRASTFQLPLPSCPDAPTCCDNLVYELVDENGRVVDWVTAVDESGVLAVSVNVNQERSW